MFYAAKSLAFKKSYDVVLFKFQGNIQKDLKKLGFGPGFSSMSPLSIINPMWVIDVFRI